MRTVVQCFRKEPGLLLVAGIFLGLELYLSLFVTMLLCVGGFS